MSESVFVVYVPMVFNEADIKRIVTGALLGGIWHWGTVTSKDSAGNKILEGKPATMNLASWCAELLLQDRDVVILDCKTQDRYALTLQRVVNGIEMFYKLHPQSGKGVFSDRDYDRIIQYGLFGKVVYERE